MLTDENGCALMSARKTFNQNDQGFNTRFQKKNFTPECDADKFPESTSAPFIYVYGLLAAKTRCRITLRRTV